MSNTESKKGNRICQKILGLIFAGILCGLIFFPLTLTSGFSSDNSLDLIKSLIDNYKIYFQERATAVMFISYCLIYLSAALNVILSIAALFFRKNEKLARYNRVRLAITLLMISAASLLLVMMGLRGKSFIKSAFALFFAVTLLFYIILLFAGAQGKILVKSAVFKTLVLLFSLACAVMLSYPVLTVHGVETSGFNSMYITDFLLNIAIGPFTAFKNIVGSGAVAKILLIVYQVFTGLVILNALITCLTTAARRTKVFDIIRFVIQFVLGAALILVPYFYLKGAEFFGSFGIMSITLLSFLAFLTAALQNKNYKEIIAYSKNKDAVETPAEQAAEVAEPQTANAASEPEKTESAAENTSNVQTEPLRADTADTEIKPETKADENSIKEEINQSQIKEEKPAEPETVVNADDEDVIITKQEPVAEQIEFNEPKNFGQEQFIRQAPPVYVSPSVNFGGGYETRQPMSYGYSENVYDKFYASLTTGEKLEFKSIFIDNVLGINSRLPKYIIGDSNVEFFQKVFIYIGKYRNHISTGLLEKLYNYVSSIN